MNEHHDIDVRIRPGVLPTKRLGCMDSGIPQLPMGDGPQSAVEVILAAPAMACSSRAANRADRRRVAKASRKLGVQASA
ncbi:hypothetical protein GCM10023201_41450 [Actinomycetospora corticicola]|uniref:Uncharacterized protein n=1 Tax=Actinomycetospora corticicola TaxID=663602 RepID=A0A7Y9DX29_9PSEU|nr:hypothetical protein [Actinomycetospora corticicola]NYD36767.1 hypothetical protein [Actinomycetospora corticicola]